MKQQETQKKTARHGYINELAKLCGCNRKTVTRALFENSNGSKADFVRKMYKTNYKSV